MMALLALLTILAAGLVNLLTGGRLSQPNRLP